MPLRFRRAQSKAKFGNILVSSDEEIIIGGGYDR
jgi:hypothetical protein